MTPLPCDGALFQAVEGGGVVLVIHDQEFGIVGAAKTFLALPSYSCCNFSICVYLHMCIHCRFQETAAAHCGPHLTLFRIPQYVAERNHHFHDMCRFCGAKIGTFVCPCSLGNPVISRCRRSWPGRGRRGRSHCSPPTICWASRSPRSSGSVRDSISRKSPGKAGTLW